MTNNAYIRQLDPIQGLIDYVEDIKPYHTKIIDVLIEYVYTDQVKLIIDEQLQFQWGPTKLAIMLCEGEENIIYVKNDYTNAIFDNDQITLIGSTTNQTFTIDTVSYSDDGWTILYMSGSPSVPLDITHIIINRDVSPYYEFDVVNFDEENNLINVSGGATANIFSGQSVSVIGSLNNDGVYTVSSSPSYDGVATSIPVTEAVVQEEGTFAVLFPTDYYISISNASSTPCAGSPSGSPSGSPPIGSPPIGSPSFISSPELSGIIVDVDAELDWTAALVGGGILVDGYEIWRSIDSNPFVLIDTVDDTILEYTDTNIDPDVVYAYYIIALADDDSQSSPSNTVNLARGSVYIPSEWCNPGGETGDTTCWSITAGAMVANNDATKDYPVGNWGFYSGSVSSSKMEQLFSTASTGIPNSVIDNGNAELVVDWWGGTFIQASPPNDQPRVNIRFLDSSSTVIGTATSGYKNPTTISPNELQCWDQYQEVAAVPPLTRNIIIELEGRRLNATSNDAKFDEVVPYLREV